MHLIQQWRHLQQGREDCWRRMKENGHTDKTTSQVGQLRPRPRTTTAPSCTQPRKPNNKSQHIRWYCRGCEEDCRGRTRDCTPLLIHIQLSGSPRAITHQGWNTQTHAVFTDGQCQRFEKLPRQQPLSRAFTRETIITRCTHAIQPDEQL